MKRSPGFKVCLQIHNLCRYNPDAARNWKAAVEETISATLNRTVSSGITGASYYTGKGRAS
jgi:hypothetical protein